MELHPRRLLPILQARLAHWPVTVLTGARQTGKTTLVRELLPATETTAPVYLSLDDPDERLRLAQDPVRRLDYGARLVILDEVQKQPALLDAVKFLADRKRGHRFCSSALPKSASSSTCGRHWRAGPPCSIFGRSGLWNG